jgi:hypothetical protein
MLRIEQFYNLDFERRKASQIDSSKLVAHRVLSTLLYTATQQILMVYW